MATARSRFAEVASGRIHYQESGQGPPLLLANMWTASGLLWPRRWVERLERSFRLLRVCNRGTGYSSPATEPFSLGDLAADALAVLDHAGVERAHVLGISMGGMLSQLLALSWPQRVERLVLLASCPPRPEAVTPSPQDELRLLTPPPEAASVAEIVRSLWRNMAAPGFAERDPDAIAEIAELSLAVPTSPEVILLQRQAIDGFDGAERLRDLCVPTLIVHGDEDPLLVVENGRRLQRLIAGSSYRELPGVGHLIPWEAHEETLALVEEFLEPVSRSG